MLWRQIFSLSLAASLLLSACVSSTPAPRIESPSPSATQTLPSIDANPAPSDTPPAQVTLLPDPTSEPTLQPEPAASTPTPLDCWQDGGLMETGQVETDLLRDPLAFRVFLPPCYAAQPERSYPVLYLVHGQSYTDDQWDRLGIDEAAAALIASAEIAPFLIVMPRDRLWKEPSDDPFGQAVVEVLVPWVDVHYRTLPDRLFRAVGGLSRGGGWAIHLGLSAWDVFGAFGAHSGFVFHTDVPHVKPWLEAIPAESLPRVYLDIGDNDRPENIPSLIWFEGLLTERGIPHEWHLFAGYHEEKYWQAHLEQYLRWYAQAW